MAPFTDLDYLHPLKRWNEIVYLFLNTNGITVDIFQWLSNFISTLQGMSVFIRAEIKVQPY